MRLQDRVVLITGGSRGIGRAVALACAKEGADVVVAAKTDAPVERAGVVRAGAREPSARKGRAWIDEDLLRDEEGATDFTRYPCKPGHEPPRFPFSALPRATIPGER